MDEGDLINMKIFISQPMGGKTEEEIDKERYNIILKLKSCFGNNIQILDTNFNFPGKNALFYLAKSLEALSEADIAFFAKDWENYRGCKIEHECCIEYNIDRIYE